MRYALLLSLLLATPLLAQGPGRGDPWSRMQRFDADGDGKVSRDEFAGPQRIFDRFDQDKDGFVTEEEVKAMRARRGGQGRGGPRGLQAPRIDSDGDAKISEAEWEAFFKKADENGDGLIDTKEWEAVSRGRPYKDSAPAEGARAPSVALKRMAGEGTADIGRPRRTTVLVFGSYT